MRPTRALVLGLACTGAALGAGCDDLDEFRTEAGSSKFLGCVVGAEGESFIRNGFQPATFMELQFDPDDATKVEAGNTITAEGVEMVMGMPDVTHRYFDDTDLRPVPTLAHDALSGYDFPGGGRVRNYIFVATPAAGPLADQNTMVFLSLMENGRIEVRVIHDAPRTAMDEGRGFFGFFRLERADADALPDCNR